MSGLTVVQPSDLDPASFTVDPVTKKIGLAPSAQAPVEQTFFINNVASYTAQHGLSYIPNVIMTLPDGTIVESDMSYGPGFVNVMFPCPFTGYLYIR